MANKTFDRIIKIMTTLLAVCFLVSLTAGAVSAYTAVNGDTNDKNTIPIHHEENKDSGHEEKHKLDNNYGRGYKNSNNHGQYYKDGYKYWQSYKDGYNKGINDAREDCIQYGSKDFIRKIPDYSIKDKKYREGFILGYTTGYNEKRYICLKISNKKL